MESNEALEQVVANRRVHLKYRAADNPVKAGVWYKLAEKYSTICKELIHSPTSSIPEKLRILNRLDDSVFTKQGYDTLRLQSLMASDSIIVKSMVLKHLNNRLNEIYNMTNFTFCGFRLPTIKPVAFNLGDSSLIVLQSNFIVDNSEYQISLESPSDSKFISQYSLGYFFSKKNENHRTSGEIEFINKSSLGGFKLAFNNDTTYAIR